MNPIVRFAPSPTGQLHIGGVRTALFNYLFALKNKGTFLLRIEDTDLERSKDIYTEQIIESLGWLGFEYQGNPVRQSSRMKRHQEVIEYLLKTGNAYRCFATVQQLAELRNKSDKYLYPRIWRDRSKEEIDAKLQEKEDYVIRIKIPLNGNIRFKDLVYGDIKTDCSELDDFIIARSDGTPTYNFTVVVDDHDMEVSHVIRGEDHISNTPKQILIYDALKWDRPEFAHLPMILGSDGKRLSKRHGAAGIQTYRDLGYLPNTLVNYLALLGWNPGTEDEVFNFQFLMDNFSLENVNKKAAVFDNKKLAWLSGQHIMKSESEDLLDSIRSIKPEWKVDGLSDEYFCSIISHLKGRSKTLLDIINQSEYFFKDPMEYDQNAVAKCWYEDTPDLLKSFTEKILVYLDWKDESIETCINDFSEKKIVSKAKLIQPLRVSLCGSLTGPSMADLMVLLGKETCIRRINNALKLLSKRW
tara:strand:+ start:31 stop:1443 length:1413 start_codon:yes stop_codon:yes gene_type:complete